MPSLPAPPLWPRIAFFWWGCLLACFLKAQRVPFCPFQSWLDAGLGCDLGACRFRGPRAGQLILVGNFSAWQYSVCFVLCLAKCVIQPAGLARDSYLRLAKAFLAGEEPNCCPLAKPRTHARAPVTQTGHRRKSDPCACAGRQPWLLRRVSGPRVRLAVPARRAGAQRGLPIPRHQRFLQGRCGGGQAQRCVRRQGGVLDPFVSPKVAWSGCRLVLRGWAGLKRHGGAPCALA
jgi:hypothetical protein